MTKTFYQLQTLLHFDKWVAAPMPRVALSRVDAEAMVPEIKKMVPTIAHRSFRVLQTTVKTIVIKYPPIP